MKLLHKKNLKEENYDFLQSKNENVEYPFKTNTTIFQILIWLLIGIVLVILLNKFFIN